MECSDSCSTNIDSVVVAQASNKNQLIVKNEHSFKERQIKTFKQPELNTANNCLMEVFVFSICSLGKFKQIKFYIGRHTIKESHSPGIT